MKTITRAVQCTDVIVVTYDEETKKGVETTERLVGKLPLSKIKKELKLTDNQMVLRYDYVEVKLSMPLQTFIENATVVEE